MFLPHGKFELNDLGAKNLFYSFKLFQHEMKLIKVIEVKIELFLAVFSFRKKIRYLFF